MSIESQLEKALGRAVEFVLAAQGADGAWTDWDLPPGPAPEWTTADVGWRLSAVADTHRAVLADPLEHAADWLLVRPEGRAGWGYSSTIDGDADSTAQALLFLSAIGRPGPPEAYTFLGRHQRPDGGFATYLPGALLGSWGHSHAEIAPVALLALRTAPGGLSEAVLTRGLAWVRGARRADGLWNSFWWSTPLVATSASIALLEAVGAGEHIPPALADQAPMDSLEAALLVSSIAGDGRTAQLETLTADLVERQEADGSWRGAPTLRITSRDCERPWDDEDPIRLYADPGRLHTTAAAIGALSRAMAALASVEIVASKRQPIAPGAQRHARRQETPPIWSLHSSTSWPLLTTRRASRVVDEGLRKTAQE